MFNKDHHVVILQRSNENSTEYENSTDYDNSTEYEIST